MNNQGRQDAGFKNRRGKDRRGVPRVRRTDIVHFTIGNLPFGRVRRDASQTKDLSETGISFTIGYPIIPQATLKIKLTLPLVDEFLELDARIVGCQEIEKDKIYAIRAAFVNVTEEQKVTLRKFVQLFSRQIKDRRQNLPD